jgi:hypothetical protein
VIVYTSQFQPTQRTIVPADFSIEPYSFGGLWPAGQFFFAYAFLGKDGKYAGLSQNTMVSLLIAGANLAIRIPGNAGSKAIGFVPFFNWPNAPDPTWRGIWFPCCPVNSQGRPMQRGNWFHFSIGDLRWNGQLLDIYPWNPAKGSAPPHWNYVDSTGKAFWPKGGIGWDGKTLVGPLTAPTVTLHGCLSPGQYAVQLAEVLPDLRECVGVPQTITLDQNHRSILIHRRGPVQQGVAARRVYRDGIPVACPFTGSTYWPRNWITFWVG